MTARDSKISERSGKNISDLIDKGIEKKNGVLCLRNSRTVCGTELKSARRGGEVKKD